MPKVGSRSYMLELEDTYKDKSIAIEPHTEIQFDITMAMYTELSIGWIKIYNPDSYLKDFILYKNPVGDQKNRLYVNLKPMMLGSTASGATSYNYCGSTKAYVYQTTLVHPNAKEEYIHLQLLSGLYDLFSETITTEENATVNTALTQVKNKLSSLGYPMSYIGPLNTNLNPFAGIYTVKDMLDTLLKIDNGSFSYLEDLSLKIVDTGVGKGKGSRGNLGSYSNPFPVEIDTGLMSYPQQVNNDVKFKFTLDHKFPLDSYVRIPKELINMQLVTPSLSAGAGGLNWLLGSEDKYRVLSYELIGDYKDPETWYQIVTAQAGNMPLAANLTNQTKIGVL